MRRFVVIIFLLYFSNSFGQFAIVNDKNNSLNVRAEGQLNCEVVDKLQNGHLVYCLDKEGNWINIDYTKKRKEQNGYVYKDGCQVVSNFPALKLSKKTATSITLKNDTIEVTITQSKFEKKKHRVKYTKNYPGQIELIDKKQYWGTDGEMPTTQFGKIVGSIGNKMFTIPQSALEGLYEPGIYSALVNYDKKNDILYIQTMNSDGAGSYLVIWKVERGIYKERFVAYGF